MPTPEEMIKEWESKNVVKQLPDNVVNDPTKIFGFCIAKGTLNHTVSKLTLEERALFTDSQVVYKSMKKCETCGEIKVFAIFT